MNRIIGPNNVRHIDLKQATPGQLKAAQAHAVRTPMNAEMADSLLQANLRGGLELLVHVSKGRPVSSASQEMIVAMHELTGRLVSLMALRTIQQLRPPAQEEPKARAMTEPAPAGEPEV